MARPLLPVQSGAAVARAAGLTRRESAQRQNPQVARGWFVSEIAGGRGSTTPGKGRHERRQILRPRPPDVRRDCVAV
jgi:hypothetical protein